MIAKRICFKHFYNQSEKALTLTSQKQNPHFSNRYKEIVYDEVEYEEVTADSKKLSEILKYYNLGGAEEHGPNSSYGVSSSLASFYGRFNYNFNEL